MIKFTVLGEPKGKGRPRFQRVGNFVRTYTDKDTISYENLVRVSYQESGCEPYLEHDTPLYARVEIYQSIPKSVSKKKRALMLVGSIRPTKKPDVDNVLKALFDGLNGVAFYDDTQIVETYVSKIYSDSPRVEVTIMALGEDVIKISEE